jgi:hypothetical protein
MRILLWLPAALLLAAPLAGASVGSVVQASDADARNALVNVQPRLGYIDVNANGALDNEPDETVYIDVDGGHAVTFGDVRLTSFLAYPAGTDVNFTNRDYGFALLEPRGWFARDGAGAWYVDMDASKTLSLGDVRLNGPVAGTKARSGEPGMGTTLELVQQTDTPTVRVGWSDGNANHRVDVGEPLYLDLNRDLQVTPGELRLSGSGYSLDQPVTRPDLDAAIAQLQRSDAQLEARLAQLEQRLGTQPGQQAAGPAEKAGGKSSPGPDTALAVLTGLVAVSWIATRGRW